MPITLRDVAVRVNLSMGLVSRVLNAKPNVMVSDDNRARIHAAALELGYRPNPTAQALRSGRTQTVIMVYRHNANAYLREEMLRIVQVTAERLNRIGYQLVSRTSQSQDELIESVRKIAEEGRCDAVVLWGEEDETEICGDILEAAQVPFVVKGRLELRHPNWNQVDFDHEGIMRDVVAHLTRGGHRRIAYIGFQSHHLYEERLLEGYRNSLRELTGAEPPEEFVRSMTVTVRGACEQMLTWLDLPEARRPTALAIGANNEVWRGVELALLSRGLTIGDGADQFAVAGMGFNDLQMLFGSGHSTTNVELFHLAAALVDRSLAPLLSGCPPESPIVRLRPRLQPMNSLRLLEYGDYTPYPPDKYPEE